MSSDQAVHLDRPRSNYRGRALRTQAMLYVCRNTKRANTRGIVRMRLRGPSTVDPNTTDDQLTCAGCRRATSFLQHAHWRTHPCTNAIDLCHGGPPQSTRRLGCASLLDLRPSILYKPHLWQECHCTGRCCQSYRLAARPGVFLKTCFATASVV